ncbi:hypothetical protein HK096_004724, partial [Nowakowskiella sp. JEL0078]
MRNGRVQWSQCRRGLANSERGETQEILKTIDKDSREPRDPSHILRRLNQTLLQKALADQDAPLAYKAYDSLRQAQLLHNLKTLQWFDLLRLIATDPKLSLHLQNLVLQNPVFHFGMHDSLAINNRPHAIPDSVVSIVLKVYAELQDELRITKLWDWLELYNASPSPTTYHLFLKFAHSRKLDMLASKVFAHLHKSIPKILPGRSTPTLTDNLNINDIIQEMYLVTLDTHAQAGDPVAAHQLFNEMHAEGYQIGIRACNQLINAYARANDHAGVERAIHLMAHHHVEPTTQTYNILIHSEARRGNPLGATTIFQKMLVESETNPKVAPTVVSFNTLLHAYAKAVDVVNANKLMDLMRTMAIQPDVVTYNTQIDLHRRAGNLDRVLALADEMSSSGLARTEVTYGALIAAHGFAKDIATAEALFDEMELLGMRPRRFVYGELMTVNGIVGKYNRMNEWYAKMRDASIAPDFRVLASLISLNARAGKWENVTFYRDEAKRFRLLDEKLCNALVWANFIVFRDLRGLKDVVLESFGKAIKPSQVSVGHVERVLNSYLKFNKRWWLESSERVIVKDVIAFFKNASLDVVALEKIRDQIDNQKCDEKAQKMKG